MSFRPTVLGLLCALPYAPPHPAKAGELPCGPTELALVADRDNTLYEDGAGGLSNGAGSYIFAGNTLVNGVRRGLLRFDAGGVPAGATITGARLWLSMSMTGSGPQDVDLFPVAMDWGEGASAAGGNEGGGAAAEPGDATWLHTFYDTDFWSVPGGDFALKASATATVDGPGVYTWGSTDAMVAVVQGWVDDPASNFGWILVGNEADLRTTKRFGSRDNPDPAQRPVLCVDFAQQPAVEIPTLGRLGWLILALGLAGVAARKLGASR